jgi:hypothetical protein
MRKKRRIWIAFGADVGSLPDFGRASITAKVAELFPDCGEGCCWRPIEDDNSITVCTSVVEKLIGRKIQANELIELKVEEV